MIDAHRQFPHVNAPVLCGMLDLRCDHLVCTNFWSTHLHHSKETWLRCRPCGSYKCTAQARHGSKEWTVRMISTGCSMLATGVPISDASKDERCCFASRGEPFQVVGTTS